PGLTLVYGENASGKSGYCRVLKKACRARGTAQDIKANAYEPAPAEPASAEIACNVGTEESLIRWRDGMSSDPRLSNIFVFDGISASCGSGAIHRRRLKACERGRGCTQCRPTAEVASDYGRRRTGAAVRNAS